MIVKTLCRALAAATLLAATAVDAALIQFSFSGTVEYDAINGCVDPVVVVVVVACGTAFTGSFSFASAASDGNTDTNLGLYAASAISLTINGTEFFSAANGVINVANDIPQDQYGLLATGTAGATVAVLSILLEDLNGSALGSDALPLSASALSPLLPGTFALFASDDSFQLQGVVDSITCTLGCGGGEVPEPSTSLLLVAGLGAFGCSRRRKSKCT